MNRAIQRILQMVSAARLIPESVITGRSRHRPHVMARMEVVYRARKQGFTLAEIGRALGRDHTSVLYLLRKAEAFNEQGKAGARKRLQESDLHGPQADLRANLRLLPRAGFPQQLTNDPQQ